MKTTPRSEAPRRVGNLPWRGVVLSLVVLVSLASTPGSAQAHSELVGSNPADRATLRSAPATITFTFSEGIAPTYAVMTLRVGSSDLATLETAVSGDRISADIPPVLRGNGDWRVAYRIVSADGHPVTGKIAFKVAAPATPTPTLAPAQTPTAHSSEPSQAAAPSGDSEAGMEDDSGSTDDGGGVNPGFSVLVLALLVSAPVAVFVVIGNRKRREDQQNPT